jgi:hypothetical protein
LYTVQYIEAADVPVYFQLEASKLLFCLIRRPQNHVDGAEVQTFNKGGYSQRRKN